MILATKDGAFSALFDDNTKRLSCAFVFSEHVRLFSVAICKSQCKLRRLHANVLCVVVTRVECSSPSVEFLDSQSK